MARRAGVPITVMRADAGAVGQHVRALTNYLLDPDPKNLATLINVEHTAARYLPEYFGAEKAKSPSDARPSNEITARERVLYTTTRNVLTTGLEDQQFEMELIAGLAPGSEDPIEHIVISWPHGHSPTPEQVEDGVDLFLKVLKMERHQVVAALHGDTEHTHLHLAINRVHPIHGERRTFGAGGMFAMDTLHASISVIAHRQGWPIQDNALYEASAVGVIDRRTGIQVLDAALDACCSKGDWAKIKAARRERERDEKLSSASLRFEQRTGLYSLQRIMLEEIWPELAKAADWSDAHRRLAGLGARYEVVAGGAHIVIGDRRCPATWAGSGASRAKMEKRFTGQKFRPSDPGLIVQPFVDREFPTLRAALERERKRQLIREAQRSVTNSTDRAVEAVAAHQAATAAAINRQDWRGRGWELNQARCRASERPRQTRDEIARLRRREIERCRRWRLLLARERLSEDFLDEHDCENVSGILLGPSGTMGRADVLAEPGLEARRAGKSVEYRRDDALLFIDHGDRIDLLAVSNDAALTAAMRLAAAKWDNKVVATGNRATLARLAKIAAEQGIELVNPELQDLIRSHRERLNAERQLDAHSLSNAALPSEFEAPAVSTRDDTPKPSWQIVLFQNYAPEFTDWAQLDADPARREEANALALLITKDRTLAGQLEELLANGIGLAKQLETGAKLAKRSLPRVQTAAGAAAIREASERSDFGANVRGLTKPSDTEAQAEELRRRISMAQAAGATAFRRRMDAIRAAEKPQLVQGVDRSRSRARAVFLADVLRSPTGYEKANRADGTATLVATSSEESAAGAVAFFMHEPDTAATALVRHQQALRRGRASHPELNGVEGAWRTWVWDRRPVPQVLEHPERAPFLLTKPRNGIFGSDSMSLVEQLGADADLILRPDVQARLEAAHWLQEQRRREAMWDAADPRQRAAEPAQKSPVETQVSERRMQAREPTPATGNDPLLALALLQARLGSIRKAPKRPFLLNALVTANDDGASAPALQVIAKALRATDGYGEMIKRQPFAIEKLVHDLSGAPGEGMILVPREQKAKAAFWRQAHGQRSRRG